MKVEEKEGNVFRVEIVSADERGEFILKGYLCVEDKVRIVMEKKYTGR